MKALTGTTRLFRLALRLDRVRLPIWIGANVGIIALTLPQLLDAYNTQQQRIVYATASASSAVTRLLNGALAGPSMGDIAVVETFLLGVLLISLMNIFLVTRHTRQEEEANRSELIGSTLVGRQAGLTSALLLALLVNVITSGLIFVVFRLNDFPVDGSLAYSVALGMLGMTFAGVAAICAQLFESARTANSVAGLVFGVSFAVRGVGDVLGQLQPSGLGVNPNFISWLSPVGWVLNIHAFAGVRWWVLAMFGILIIALVATSYVLLSIRDVGASLFAPRPGRAHASPNLLRRYGLIWRLNRTSTIAWAAAIIASGATIGAVAHEFTALIEGNEEMQRVLAEIGGNKAVTDILFGVMFMIIGIATTAYAVQVLTRMRSEESSGRLELLFSAAVSRWRWLFIYVSYSILTSTLILFLTGLVAGFVYGAVGGGMIFENMRSLSGSALVYVPAICVMLGATLVFFGALPRLFVALSWAVLVSSLLIFQLQAVLKLPQWVVNISPFSHTPPAPSTDITILPLAILSGVAFALLVAGFASFRHRDVISN
jgi:ABC-2 type transport system permease protein